MTAARPAACAVRCPRCRSSDLEIGEIITAGTFWTITDGRLDMAQGVNEPGETLRVTGSCSRCGHGWRLRARTVLSVFQEPSETLSPEARSPR